MDERTILAAVDHTLLDPAATWEQIKAVCDDGMRYHTATVCIPQNRVRRAAEYLAGRLPVCTVIGFPTGCQTTAVKCAEAADAVKNGAAELDMVVPLGLVKERRYAEVTAQIRAVKAAGEGRLLKVIIETCRLTEEEKIALCTVVSEAGADFIKTSTGFSTGGATKKDVALLVRHVAPGVRVKAAGGIHTLADAEAFLRLGAARLGTSAVVRLIKEKEMTV